MFSTVDKATKEMLRESGEIQRAYMVTLVFNEAYDAYVDKHKDIVAPEQLHSHAESAAYFIVNIVFGQKQ